MGLNELVLKVPASEAPGGGGPSSGSGGNRPPSAPNIPQGGSSTLKPSIRRKSSIKSKTHSRESSGASNLSVKFSVSEETASVSNATSNTRLRNNRTHSDEDLTLSDRLSHEDLELDDGFVQGSKSCESIPQDRRTPDSQDEGGGR